MKSFRALLPCLLLLFSCSAQRPMIQPRALKPGDRIALVTPSFVHPLEAVDTLEKILADWGYETVRGPRVGAIYADAYGGTAAERAEDLRWALTDPEVDAVLCVWGGYGTLHLAGLMEDEDFRKDPKWLIGFSDITTLNLLAFNAGVMSLHATLGDFIAKFGGRDASSLALRDFLAGEPLVYEGIPAGRWDIPGEASGTFVGGNLATVIPLLGTPYDPLTGKDLILFVEEVEESYHHIDRMFNMLKLHGVLGRVRGVVLGQFTKCGADLGYESVEEMVVTEYLAGLGIPVLTGFPAGHEADHNFPLVIGAPVTIKVKAEGKTLRFDLQ